MLIGHFKNDNRANPTLVIEHIVAETEKNIEKMTGRIVKLVAYEVKKSIY